MLFDDREGAIEDRRLDVVQDNPKSVAGEYLGDALAHGARAEHSHLMNGHRLFST